MTVLKKKICMLGGSAVGKTSLVHRFVRSMFSDKYMTTVGVKIDQKTVVLDEKRTVELILWDIHGDDEFQNVRRMYLRGMAGYFLVIDGTRRSTLDKAHMLRNLAVTTVGDIPFVLIVNKSDLSAEWEITKEDLDLMREQGWHIVETSAKEDCGVTEAFEKLAKLMITF